MTPERWARLKSLFEQVLDESSTDRSRFIRDACGNDPGMESSLRNLVDHHELASSLLDGPLVSQERIAEYLSAGLRTFEEGELIAGRFRIERFIGEGGMGEVYAAEDLELGEHVALKTLRPVLSSDEGVIARFKQEIQIARKVTHPNVSRVFDLFRHDTRSGSEHRTIAFLTMELLDGETLADRIRSRGLLTEPEALAILEQVVEGLTAAHKAGIVHRDLKSGNILLVQGLGGRLRAAVTDFGLARLKEDVTAGDGPRAIAGTPAYIAPEQVEGGRVTAAADIYALGVVLFEMVTGRLPFVGKTPWETAERRLHEAAPSPKQFVPNLDSRWVAAIQACLERDPSRRPATAAEVLEQIRSHRRLSRRTMIGVLLSGAAAVGVSWIWLRPHARDPQALRSFKRGEEFAQRRNAEGLRNAVEEFRRAIELEPDYAAAWGGLADAYSAMANFNFMDPQTALGYAKDSALRAVAIDPKFGKALGVLGYVTSLDVHQWRDAELYFRRAVSADPQDPSVRLWFGAHLGKMGRSAEALQQIQIGLEQAPSSLALNQQLATEYFRARRFREQYEQAREVVRLQPFEASAHLALARALEWQKRYDEALHSCEEAQKYKNSEAALCFRGSVAASRGNMAEARRIAHDVREYWEENPFETILLVALDCQIGENVEAISLLNRGYERGDSTVLTAPTNPYLDSLNDLPAYRSFLARIAWTKPPAHR